MSLSSDRRVSLAPTSSCMSRRDADALLVHGRLLFELPHAVAQSSERDVAHDGDHSERENRQRQAPKPPGLPEKRRDIEGDGGPGFIPDAGIVAGDDAEFVVPRRQPRVGHARLGPGLDPLLVETHSGDTGSGCFPGTRNSGPRIQIPPSGGREPASRPGQAHSGRAGGHRPCFAARTGRRSAPPPGHPRKRAPSPPAAARDCRGPCPAAPSTSPCASRTTSARPATGTPPGNPSKLGCRPAKPSLRPKTRDRTRSARPSATSIISDKRTWNKP